MLEVFWLNPIEEFPELGDLVFVFFILDVYASLIEEIARCEHGGICPHRNGDSV